MLLLEVQLKRCVVGIHFVNEIVEWVFFEHVWLKDNVPGFGAHVPCKFINEVSNAIFVSCNNREFCVERFRHYSTI